MKTAPHYDERTGHYFTRLQGGGKRVYFPLGTSKKKAEARLQELLKRQDRGELFATAKTTMTMTDGKKDMALQELAHRYLEYVKKNRSPATYAMRQRILIQFLQFADKDSENRMWVSQITPPLLADFYADAKQRNANRVNGGNSHLREVKTMLRWAEGMELIDMPVRKFPSIREVQAQTKIFEKDELDKLVNVSPPEFADMIMFNALTGLRPHEITGLTYDQLTACPDGRQVIHIEPKDVAVNHRNHRARNIPLCKPAEEIIKRQRSRNPQEKIVFVNGDGLPYGKASVYRNRLKRMCEKAGIKERSPYALRHVFGTTQGRINTGMNTVKDLMGHNRISTTERYMHHVDANCVGAVDALGEYLGGGIR